MQNVKITFRDTYYLVIFVYKVYSINLLRKWLLGVDLKNIPVDTHTVAHDFNTSAIKYNSMIL